MSDVTPTDTTPAPPRRLFLASGVAALVAGGAVLLATLGQVTAPGTQTFQFARGTAWADGEEARIRAYLSQAAQDDRIAVVITGHSGTSGDEQANLDLSAERAALAVDIASQLGVAGERISSGGVGGGAPLSQDSGEADRSYQARLARVDVTLQVRR